jgi:hypothetical protein
VADPTPADIEAANRALVPPIEEAGVGIATRIARARATARREGDAAGYARGLREAADLCARHSLHGLAALIRHLTPPPTPEPTPEPRRPTLPPPVYHDDKRGRS